jgi:hypothetical protein
VAELRGARRIAAMDALRALAREETNELKAMDFVCLLKVVEGDPAIETARVGREYDADLVVIPTHGYAGLKDFLLGGTVEKVVLHAPCLVLVVPEKDLKIYADPKLAATGLRWTGLHWIDNKGGVIGLVPGNGPVDGDKFEAEDPGQASL